MVEFGLKLEDNKVSEWTDKYINYEKLKSLLKKAELSKLRYEELCKRHPEIAARIKQAFDNGIDSRIQSPQGSSLTLATLTESATASPVDANPTTTTTTVSRIMSERSLDRSEHEPSETTNLLAESSRYGSHTSLSSAALSNVIQRAVTGVADYFGNSYERQLRDSLKDLTERKAEFGDMLVKELDKVNRFYEERLEDLETQLQCLVESVSRSKIRFFRRKPPGGEESDDEETNAILKMVRKVSVMIKHGHSPSPSFDFSEFPMDLNVSPHSSNAGEAESIKRALEDQFRTAKLLHNFAILNYTGFVKIIKKHNKLIKEDKGLYDEMTEPSRICKEGKHVEALLERMEIYFANWFCQGDIRAAHAQMLPKRGDGLQMDWSQLRLGYRMGMCSILSLWVCWDCVWGRLSRGESTIAGRAAFPVFRGCGGLLLLQWFWGCSVYVWNRYRINYIYLFDFNPRIVLSPLSLFNDAVNDTLVFLICMLLYYKAGAHHLPEVIRPGGYALFLVAYTIVKLIFPLRRRAPMWTAIWQVVTTPMTSPTFFTSYLGDIFTSMVKVFQDLAWTLCFFLSGEWLLLEESQGHFWTQSLWYKNILVPIICLLPLYFRFNQCMRRFFETGDRFPHLANAFKYALSQTVTLFGAFHPLYRMKRTVTSDSANYFQLFWAALFVVSSLYSFTWDLYMDWGLGRIEDGFLATQLMFPRRSYYYAVIAIDLVLRFMWVLTLVPPESGARFEVPQYLAALSMILELFRRTLWGFFRLENEHRSKASDFKRRNVVPLHFSTGHKHAYDEMQEHRGFSVLAEVALVSILVVAICIFSIIAATRLDNQDL